MYPDIDRDSWNENIQDNVNRRDILLDFERSALGCFGFSQAELAPGKSRHVLITIETLDIIKMICSRCIMDSVVFNSTVTAIEYFKLHWVDRRSISQNVRWFRFSIEMITRIFPLLNYRRICHFLHSNMHILLNSILFQIYSTLSMHLPVICAMFEKFNQNCFHRIHKSCRLSTTSTIYHVSRSNIVPQCFWSFNLLHHTYNTRDIILWNCSYAKLVESSIYLENRPESRGITWCWAFSFFTVSWRLR